ncbi:hypothetical protein AB5J72_03060 [Streptomyces sp. CG1]|uniref:hypothetical protein n=1 Tax=Streptomyces sp. CG1 TaxID=1287523 RepID=UPI0034E20AED
MEGEGALSGPGFHVWVEMLPLVGMAPRAVATGVLPSNRRDGRAVHITRDDSATVAAAAPWSATGIAERNSWYDITTHTVQRLTGRPATPITEYFAAHRAELAG